MDTDDISGDDDSWVLVEKQVISILVSPPSPEQIRSQPRNVAKDRLKKPPHQKKLKPQKVAKQRRRGGGRRNQSETLASQSEHDIQMETMNTSQHVINTTSLHRDSCKITCPPAHNDLERVFSNGKQALVKCRSLKTGIGGQFSHHCPPVGAVDVVNLRIKAGNLERQLERSGGLNRWLMSQGLAQFVGLFEKEKLDKYHLVNLTMGKLKDMGADAVGPRRKLIHAIDYISQPYFKKPSGRSPCAKVKEGAMMWGGVVVDTNFLLRSAMMKDLNDGWIDDGADWMSDCDEYHNYGDGYVEEDPELGGKHLLLSWEQSCSDTMWKFYRRITFYYRKYIYM